MQLKTKMSALVAALILVMSTGVWAGPAAPSEDKDSSGVQGPQAVFPETRFQFEPLFEGEDVTHDFVVENKGDAPLVIKNVKPG